MSVLKIKENNEWKDIITIKGAKGDKGDTGTFNSVTATVDQVIGTPEVAVTYDKGDVDFAFSGLKGEKGDPGTYQTTAPTEAIYDGGVHIVYLQSEPANKYDGYIYLIAQ